MDLSNLWYQVGYAMIIYVIVAFIINVLLGNFDFYNLSVKKDNFLTNSIGIVIFLLAIVPMVLFLIFN